ncbi:hypothetical protein BDZ89DRAFT_1022900 [Hymenopellis radicata]|nr:hypothetical protein BDZ89DRAFT_1022900 [Hymenopellis radicata]
MPRENSFSDEGRSLTPDLSEEEDANGGAPPISPTYSTQFRPIDTSTTEAACCSLRRRSIPSILASPAKAVRRPPIVLTPKDRFRTAVRKVMHMRRTTHNLSRGVAGAEPGVDPRRASADLQFGHIRQNCIIETFDYSAVRNSYGRMTNREFVNFMQDDNASAPEPWVKVRWINIAGISWDVVKAVSLKYDIHPLALEDVFHARSQTRSKADYYAKHLFLRVVVHELGDPDEPPAPMTSQAAYGSTLTALPRSSSPLPFTEDDEDNYEMKDSSVLVDDDMTMYGSGKSRRTKPSLRRRATQTMFQGHHRDVEKVGSTFSTRLGKLDILDPEIAARKRAREEEVALSALKREGDSVNVKVYPMFIFLFRDGTIISMNSRPNINLTQSISHRLNSRDTVLRSSADPSLLVQGLLDLIVDKALEVIDEYQVKIQKFERAILYQPQIKTVRALHILNGDLILHKRTMEPIKTVVYGLRRYDLDRCAALVDTTQAENANVRIVGYMSHKSKIYLADVYDHVEYMLSSLDMFADISQNLIDYTFNMTSYGMNQDMRRLTLATIIFLPLTLLTGYFGMNFESMWSVNKHSDLLFWEIGLPVMAVVIPTFLAPDIRRFFHYVHKRMITKEAIKSVKQA